MNAFVLPAFGVLVMCGLIGCESKLNVAPIEDNIEQTLLRSRHLLVDADCPKDRKLKDDAFACAVALPDGTALEARVEVSEYGEVSWTIDLNSKAYIEATLKQSIAQRRTPKPLTPTALSCPDALNPEEPIHCDVTWPTGQASQIEVSFQQNLPTWRAPSSLRMYDTPDALLADLTTRAQTTAQLPIQTLACGDADTLLIHQPLRCQATLADPSKVSQEQVLSITLGEGSALQFALAP